MRKLALSVLAAMLLFSGTAAAHNGALSLYMTIADPGSPPSWVCHADIGMLETVAISLYYIKDQGQDLGKAAEFKLLSSDPAAIFISEAWSSLVQLTLGDVDNGISLTASQCMGAGETVVYLGDISVFYTAPAGAAFTVRVLPDPNSQPPDVYITACDPQNTLIGVLGGTFVFNGSCDPGVQTKTWGAIKELFK
jgi:hypothetical protein